MESWANPPSTMNQNLELKFFSSIKHEVGGGMNSKASQSWQEHLLLLTNRFPQKRLPLYSVFSTGAEQWDAVAGRIDYELGKMYMINWVLSLKDQKQTIPNSNDANFQ